MRNTGNTTWTAEEAFRLGSQNEADIVLTSGATEANNLVLQGLLSQPGRGALVHSAIEHKCIMQTAAALRERGARVSVIPVDEHGRIEPSAVLAAVEAAAARRTLVSVMHANNEIGSVAPLAAIGAVLEGTGAIFHTDAAQSAGRIPIDVAKMQLDFVSLSSHKVGGPAGIGAVYMAPDLRSDVSPLFYGGGQQGGLRPGTIPVFLAVGYGVACELVIRRMLADAAAAEAVADAFVAALRGHGVELSILGDHGNRLPGLRSVRLLGVDARDLLDRIAPQVSASTGAACAAGEMRSSHVLSAIGLSSAEAAEVMRFGFDRTVSEAAAQAAAAAIAEAARAAAAITVA